MGNGLILDFAGVGVLLVISLVRGVGSVISLLGWMGWGVRRKWGRWDGCEVSRAGGCGMGLGGLCGDGLEVDFVVKLCYWWVERGKFGIQLLLLLNWYFSSLLFILKSCSLGPSM